MNKNSKFSFSEVLKYDLASGVVVFLVALPLCMGIALASGAPLLSGVIAGIVGGTVVALLSGSNLAVTGPAAGLTVIVWDAIEKLESFEAFLLAVLFAGILQLIFGFLKAGSISNYFPSTVIKGMLAAIGIILILKQIPHALGYDIDYIGDFDFRQWDHENTFSEIIKAFSKFTPGAIVVSLFSIALMIFWPKLVPGKMKLIPAPLLVVIIAIFLNELFHDILPVLYIAEEHMVRIPEAESLGELAGFLSFPDFSQVYNKNVYFIALTLAIVASLETLLSVSAIDKLDPQKRSTPPNRELKAQGVGNIVSSLFGGLPMTAVIVRGAANVSAGAKTKYSSFFHGLLLLLSLVLFPHLLNKIPLAALAAILLVIGYKLTNIDLYRSIIRQGWEHYVPFLSTILAIVFTDLLTGIAIGMAVAALFILRRNLLNPFTTEKQDDDSGHKIKIIFSEEVSFLNKAQIIHQLSQVPTNSKLIIDGSRSKYVDDDIFEIIEEFRNTAAEKNINMEVIGMRKAFEIFHHGKMENLYKRDYQQLFENNRNWVREKLAQDPDYFKKLAEGHTPKYLFIGCSDSRVPANEITGTNPGEMFVHRNIANLVVHTDMNLMAVLHYAVEVLRVEHVIVCGHYGCGGVRAAIDTHDHGLVDKWLTNIKDVYRLYYNELESISNHEERHRRLVELNVREQVYHLSMTSVIQNAWKDDRGPHIHGWVYDLREGYLKDLNIDIQNDLKNYKNLYEITPPAIKIER
jgi:carbonic anhydrase